MYAVLQQRARAGPAQLVRNHRAHEHVALESRSGLHDCLHGADGGDDAALVVVRPHAPYPAVLELRAVRIDRPPAHLHTGVHVPVEHETRPSPGAGEAADGLSRRLAGLGGVRDLEHLDLQTDVRQVVGEEVRYPLLFEGRARNTDRRLLEREDLLIGDPSEDAVGQVSRHHRLRSPLRLHIAPTPGRRR